MEATGLGHLTHYDPRACIAALPNEIWDHVFSMMQSLGLLLKDHLSFALTCRSFHAIYAANIKLNWIDRSFLPLFFQTKGKSILKCPQIKSIGNIRATHMQYLTNDFKGRSYFFDGSVLYILKPNEDDFFVCELYQDTREEGVIRQNVMEQKMQFEIKACYPHEDGFILVTRGWIYVWKYQDDNPHIVSQLTPFNNEANAPEIKSTVIMDGALFSFCFPGNGSSFICKLQSDLLITLESPLLFGKMIHIGNQLVFLSAESLTYLTPLKENDTKLSIKKEIAHHHSFSGALIVWRESLVIHSLDNLVHIFDLKTHKVTYWNIDYHYELFENPRYFVQKDFLFILAGKEITAIYLPTQKDFSDEFAQLLKPYSPEEAVTLLSLSIDARELRLVFKLPDHFERINIPYKIEDPTPTNQFIALPNLAPSNCTKVTFVANLAFLLITIVCVAVITWHPEAVVYVGSGLLQTAPAILIISIGGSAALVLSAIGSYAWWRAKKASKEIGFIVHSP